MARRGRFTDSSHGAMGFDEDLTRSDQYDEEMDTRDFVSGGTDLVNTQHGAVTTGNIASRQSGVPTPDAVQEQPMTEEEVLAVIDAELSNCSAQYSGELAENRMAAMRYYEGKMGSPPPGRSIAVSTDVADVLEWTLPQVVDALTMGNVVVFDAQSEDDKTAAQLETDACEHVMFQENQGWVAIYSIVKDALLQKNGIAKVYQDESTSVEKESYTGLTEQELMVLLMPQDGSKVQPTAHSEYMEEGVIDQMTGQPLILHDIEVSRYRENDSTKFVELPPEEFLVNRDHQSVILEDARFTAHKRLATESELIAEGWDPQLVRDLPTYSVDETGEREERRTLEDEKDFGYDASDRAVRRIQVIECYARIDQDRDGIAELLQVHVAGSGSYYLMGIEDQIACHPFVGTTAILMSHKFYGRSLYDRCKEIQDQKTEVVRQIQDNLKHQNNARTAVVAGQVNLDDLLTSRPGGVVRQKQPGMIEPLAAPQIGELGYKHLEYLDNVRTGRAGVSPDTASVAEAIAGDTAHGLERLMSAKEELTGLMIRLFAETLLKGVIFKIRALMQRHRRSPLHFEARGKWHTVNPSQWTNRTGASIQPGLGNGDRLKRLRALQAIASYQEKAWADPQLQGVLVTPTNLFNTATEMVRATNISDPSPFWQDPTSPEAQQVIQQRQQEQQMMQQAQQQAQQLMLRAQAAIEYEKEVTKRMQLQQKQLTDQSDIIYKYQQLTDTLRKDYTKLELEYGTDVPGEGMEGGAGNAGDQQSAT